MLEYNRKNNPLAKTLRTNMTQYEKKLWYKFLRSYPIRFHRQKPIGNYIVDFYCAKAKLVIEIDGGGHYQPNQFTYDVRRTQEFEKIGLNVLRFTNLEIEYNFRGVCEVIDKTIKKL